jgi:flagellar basal-body rod modification protein FlgD
MTSPIGTIPAAGSTPVTTPTPSASSSTDTDDKDMFLKLLIAQMKNQDPSNPTDSTQYISQMATFSEVEKLETIADSQASLLTSSQLTSAVTMVGSKVEYGAGDKATSGIVSGVTVVDGVPELLVGTDKVALTDVTKITAAPATTPTPTPAPATA